MNYPETQLESEKWLTENLVECALCKATTYHKNELCNSCQVPLAFSTSLASSGTDTRFIPILGTRGVGKTTYTAMLLELLRQGSEHTFASLVHPSTRALQRDTLTNLFERRFPQPTDPDPSNWNWVQTELSVIEPSHLPKLGPLSISMLMGETSRVKARFNWVTPDMAGSIVEEAFEHADSFPIVTGSISNAAGIVMLLDATKVIESGDGFQDQLATNLAMLVRRHAYCSGETNAVEVPVAITFTKTDRCQEAVADPQEFARKRLHQFYDFVLDNIPHHRYFAASVAGGVAKVRDNYYVPFQIQPCGVVEPFSWVVRARF